MKRSLIALALLTALASTAAAQEPARQLTLKEAVRLAVQNNLDVRAELYNPATAEAEIHKYEGIYNTSLSLLVNYQDSDTWPSYNGGTRLTALKQTTTAYNAALTQLMPSGGTVEASFNNSLHHSNYQTGDNFDNYFQSDFSLNLTQPLLKNFGRETTELNINVAKFNKQGALEQFKARLLDIVAQVKTQYFQLYDLREKLKVNEASLRLAQVILKNTQSQFKAGVLPAFEILNAKFGLAAQQKNLIDAKRAVVDQVDTLRLLLQLHDTSDIIPVDKPFNNKYLLDEEREIKRALTERPDLKEQRTALKTTELQYKIARNRVRPDLSLLTSASFTGLADGYNRDLEHVGSGSYPIWSVGLQLTYPLGNDAAKNDFIMSKLKVAQSRTQIRSLEEQIVKEVRTAVRGVRSTYLSLDVTAKGRSYADEVLQAYIKKQQAGLATTKDVLDVLNNEIAAKANEIQAVVDYNDAIVTLWKTTGELLKREGIKLDVNQADTLYAQSASSVLKVKD